MGRSSAACFKIIACGSDAADNDDLDAPEAKVSSDKRGWSFRKRSGRHRVQGNNVSLDTPTSAGKETPQGVNSEFQSPIKSVVADEKSQLPRTVEKNSEAVFVTVHDDDSKTSEVAVTSENNSSVTYTESKIGLPVDASDIPSSPTPAELKSANEAVDLEKDNNTAFPEPKIADAAAISHMIDESVTVSENVDDAGVILEEPAAITIQSAIRGFLARRELVKFKGAVKLQAAIRGHLVRKKAVESLHCIRAIVKVQALVRARSSKFLDKKGKPNDTRFSTVTVLRNSFARQLLASTPKPKSVKIRCDPLSPNSAWGWLERWMSVSSSEVAPKPEPALEPEAEKLGQKTVPQSDAEDSPIVRFHSVNSKFVTDEVPQAFETEENHAVHDVSVTESQSSDPLPKEEQDDNTVEESAQQADTEDSSIIRFYSVKSKFITDEVEIPVEDSRDDIVDDVDTDDSQTCHPVSAEEKIQETALQDTEQIQEEESPATVNAPADETSHSQAESISLADRQLSESEEPKLSMKRSAAEELEGEGKKFMHVSRKASNPAFIAAHSKFEELSSATNSDKAVSPSSRDAEAKSYVDSASSVQETTKNANEPSLTEISAPSDLRIQIAGSECGTELSVSFTFDSPDRSDVVNTEAEQDKKFSEEISCDPTCREGPDGETDDMSGHIETELPSEGAQQEEVPRTDCESVNPAETEISPAVEQKVEMNSSDVQSNIEPVRSVTVEPSCMERKEEKNAHDMQVENDSGMEHEARKLSPEASPNSHMTLSESQGTPSSQVLVKGKRNKTDKTGSNVRRSSLSSGKKSPSKPTVDSGMRSSTEHLPKEHKSSKRRNSFGSTKSDNADQEPRDSSSRNPLPSYMQATESARAKAHSPRSSPDVHDKEVQLKKRHSLPGAGGRQGSPHVQRSPPQVTQGAKANGSTERKWQR